MSIVPFHDIRLHVFSFDYYQIMVIVNILCVSIAFGEVVIKLGKEQWVSGRYLP